MSVGLRLGLNRRPDVALATLATVVGAFVVALIAAAAEAPSRGVHAGAAWPFLLAGILQPGVGQLLVTLAIREAGASRASVVFGVAPLVDRVAVRRAPDGALPPPLGGGGEEARARRAARRRRRRADRRLPVARDLADEPGDRDPHDRHEPVAAVRHQDRGRADAAP